VECQGSALAAMQVHVCTPSKAPFIPFLSWHHRRKNVSPRKEGADFLRAPHSSSQPQRKPHVCVGMCVCTRTILSPVIGEGPCFGGVKKTFAFFLEAKCAAVTPALRSFDWVLWFQSKTFYGIDRKADSHHHIPALQE
jgi:hypothetical protein